MGALTSQDIHDMTMRPIDRTLAMVAEGMDNRRRRDQALEDESRRRRQALEDQGRQRGEQMTDALIERYWTVADRKDARRHAAAQQEDQMRRAIAMHLITAGVLDPKDRDNEEAVSEAMKQISPQSRQALQERVYLLEQVTDLTRDGEVMLPEGATPEAMELPDLRTLVGNMRRDRARVTRDARVEATRVLRALDDAQARLTLTPAEEAAIEERVIRRSGKDPLRMTKEDKLALEQEVGAEIEREQGVRLFQYQQASKRAERVRATPLYDESGGLMGVDPTAGAGDPTGGRPADPTGEYLAGLSGAPSVPGEPSEPTSGPVPGSIAVKPRLKATAVGPRPAPGPVEPPSMGQRIRSYVDDRLANLQVGLPIFGPARREIDAQRAVNPNGPVGLPGSIAMDRTPQRREVGQMRQAAEAEFQKRNGRQPSASELDTMVAMMEQLVTSDPQAVLSEAARLQRAGGAEGPAALFVNPR